MSARKRSEAHRTELPDRDIYDGQTYLGKVSETGCGRWQAATADGRLIGSYLDERAATDAVLATRHAS